MRVKLVKEEDGCGYRLELGSRTWVTFINEWRQFLHVKRFNWVTFTIIKLVGEYEGYSKMYDLECYLLGFGINIRYDLDFENSEIKQRADETYERIMQEERENGDE